MVGCVRVGGCRVGVLEGWRVRMLMDWRGGWLDS